MFRNCMTRSLDLIVEGIDRGDVRLILSESAAFQSAFNELKGSIDDFVKLIGEVGLEGLKEPYANLDKLVGEAEQSLQDMPDEWDWKGQLDTLKKPTGDSPPETLVSKIALDHDTNVNACKDGIIAIAQYLEQYKDLFNVGSAGLSLNEKFKSVLRVDQFRLAQLVDPDVFMFELVGVQRGSNQEENDKAVKEAWKELWDSDGNGEEKKYTDFVNMMQKLSKGIEQLWKDCGKAIETGKPSDNFQQDVPKKGLVKSLLGGLFGSSSPTKIDPAKVMGSKPDDPKGLLGMPFDNLSGLVVGLLKMSGAASEAASGAVEAIDDNQEEMSQDIPATDIRDKLIKGFGEKPEDENDLEGMPKTTKAMVAFREILDKRDFTLEDIKKVEGLPEKMTQVSNPYKSEDEVNEVLEILDLKEEEQESPENIEDDLKDILNKVEDDDLRSELQAMLQDEYIDVDDGEVTPREDLDTDELVADLDKLDDPEGDLNDDLRDELKDILEPEELPESFVRWHKLAGIIKG